MKQDTGVLHRLEQNSDRQTQTDTGDGRHNTAAGNQNTDNL